MLVQLEPDVEENYRALKEQRGCSWEQLALEQDHEAAAAARRAGGLIGQDVAHRQLAAWFRQQAPEPAEREGTTPEPASPGPAKRTATPAGPKRTA